MAMNSFSLSPSLSQAQPGLPKSQAVQASPDAPILLPPIALSSTQEINQVARQLSQYLQSQYLPYSLLSQGQVAGQNAFEIGSFGPQQQVNYPAQNAPSMLEGIHAPYGDRLVNSALGYFQSVPTNQDTSLSIILPIGPESGAIRYILPQLLSEGSLETKEMMEKLKAQGFDIMIQVNGDKIELSIAGDKGQEKEIIQAALKLVFQPRGDHHTFETIRKDILNSFEKALNQPSIPIHEAAQKALYGKNHPYAMGRKEIGEMLKKLSLEEVTQHYNSLINNPSQFTMIMVSPKSLEAQQALLNQGIQDAAWFNNPFKPSLKQQSVSKPNPGPEPKKPIFIPNNNARRTYIIRGWHAPTMGSKDYAPFHMLQRILRNKTGAFFQIFRNTDGLVYSTSKVYSDHIQGADYKVLAQVDNDRIKDGIEAYDAVVKELITKPINQAELDKAKNQYLLDLNWDLQSSQWLANRNADWLVFHHEKPRSPKELKALFDRVTAQDIQRVAKKYFSPDSDYSVTVISGQEQALEQYKAEIQKTKNQAPIPLPHPGEKPQELILDSNLLKQLLETNYT